MKAEWLMERGGMVLMITHPDYLCHPRIRGKLEGQRSAAYAKLRRAKEVRDQRSERMVHTAKRKDEYDGWLHSNDRDVQEVRERGIVEEKRHGSLLEQYAGFLNWFKREFEGRYRHCLANEVVHRLRRLHGFRD